MSTAVDLINNSVVDKFSLFVRSGRLAHAYLFLGPKKTGKLSTAIVVSKLVNCENLRDGTFCDQCATCIKINSGNHPDIHILEDSSQAIKIEDIRLLINEMQFRAYEAKTKIFLIHNAERLTIEASNALLKTLEEPSKGSLIILTTSAPERLLGTIRSRCQSVHFFSLDNKLIQKQLTENYGCDQLMAHFLAHFSDGSLGRLNGDYKGIFDRKNEAIDQFVFEQDSEIYFKKILSDKLVVREVVYFLFLWFKDLMMLKNQSSDQHLANIDRLSDLKYFEKKYEFKEIVEILNDIVATRRAIDENFNIKVPLVIMKEKIWKK